MVSPQCILNNEHGLKLKENEQVYSDEVLKLLLSKLAMRHCPGLSLYFLGENLCNPPVFPSLNKCITLFLYRFIVHCSVQIFFAIG